MLPTPCWARFRRFGDRWFAFAGVPGTGTIDALQLVIDAPEFLGADADQALPRAAMAPPELHSNRVLVAVDEAGGVQLAVCPESSTDSAVVVGDLLATGRRFWRKNYNALAGPFQEFLGMSLTDWIAARVSNGWSADSFRAGLERSLAQGKFPITVVVNELDSAVKETLDYLREINQQVRVLGYAFQTSGGDELVWPRELSESQVAPTAQPARPEPRPSTPQHGPKAPPRPQPTPAEERSPAHDSRRAVSVQPQPAEPTGFGPLPPCDATPEQKEILNRLVQLDDLGLIRKGFDYYLPSDELKATPTVVFALDPDRWPFPKPEEVIVVVNIGPEHMAGFLNIAPNEVEEFLGPLPRAEQKEHKGTLLLRAASIYEAAQIVNELRALKEVTATSIN
jgi:hypothetical protein